ncbi:hypothetical protein GOBAR_AA34499 [Gossypium barbadense]|uniref:Uncharacterized protein n=1 Tax=Gossypium barbadense TaxID=3634 RepID=A0A2P5W543_GOSBA|nr:hypothetical protein GOBAR_AA34499 [Gossypium barbadense]
MEGGLLSENVLKGIDMGPNRVRDFPTKAMLFVIGKTLEESEAGGSGSDHRCNARSGESVGNIKVKELRVKNAVIKESRAMLSSNKGIGRLSGGRMPHPVIRQGLIKLVTEHTRENRAMRFPACPKTLYKFK